jgi:uncharacterized membrane protein SpoIIM required for sporulation
MLESLISVKEGLKSTFSIFYFSSLITLVSFIISFLIFKQDVGLYTVFFITFGLTPFMYKLNLYVGKKEFSAEERRKRSFLSFYREIILSYVAVFAGITLVLSLLYLLLPYEISERTFKTQIEEIKAIRGYFSFGGTFQTIFINNVGVLFLSFLLSFLYGSGAIFILSWNASILATAIGMTAKTLGGIKALPLAAMVYFPHGSLEILAYFLAAIAGGIVSYFSLKEKLERYVLEDAFFLLSLGIFLLLIAAAIETLSMLL